MRQPRSETAFVFLTLFSALLLSVEGAGKDSLTSKFELCKSNDPDINKCFRGAVESAFRTLKDGDHSLGIVPLDPMFVPEIAMSRSDGPVGLNLKFINCTHYGLSTIKVISAKVSPDKQRFELKLSLPSFTMTGPYETKGRILVLPIVGKGNCNISMYDSDIDWTFQGKPVKRNGKTYLEIADYKVYMKPTRASIHLENLYNGDTVLGETTNRFLNENSSDVIRELAPDLNEALSRLHKGLAQRIMDRLPLEEAFPGFGA